MFLQKWVTATLIVYPALLGILHPLIAHGFTGDHDKLLTTPQFIMHSVSIFIFVIVMAVTRNNLFGVAGKKKGFADIWPFLVFTPAVFWLGYYTLYVPFDILFMFLSIGIINAIQLRKFVKSPTRWIWQCILGYLLAAVAGILIGLGAYLRYYKNFHGLSRDFATWISISTPAAIVVAYYFRFILSKQIVINNQQDKILKDKSPYAAVA